MACCDWDTFKDSFLDAWRKKNAGELLIDWVMAKRDWRRFHCTGGEAARMQLVALAREADYLWVEQMNNLKKHRGDDDGGIAIQQPIPV